MKRLLATLLAAAIMVSTAVTGTVPAYAAEAEDDASKYVTLDGDWHFKLYRTYSQMFQYFAFVPSYIPGNWTDEEACTQPDKDTWESWDVLQMPYDNPESGGLLSHELAPKWSESWVVREFDLPEDFTEEEEVTLLLGIIDDMDVVYINGEVVAASGFVDGTGTPTTSIPERGGFDYSAADKADQVKFGSSYWQIEREYSIPTDVLNLGGTNEIAIRLYNNNDYGGFYSGNPYAICGNDLAVRALKGLPTELAESEEVEQAVADQVAAIEAGDADAYADTVAENYHNDAAVKADRVAEIEALIEDNDALTVEDAEAAIYIDDDGNYWYSAVRTISADGESVSTESIEVCYVVEDGEALERGNWNRCYGTSYASELFNKDLTYSVYLPPSYYENENRSYPTVWLLHGMNSSSSSFLNVDKIGAFMDEQIDSGDVVEMIVIMPDSGKTAFYSDTELNPADTDGSGPWRTQLTDELRGVAEETYRIIDGAEFRGLTGISMGGYGAMAVGTSFPELYSSVGVHMGALTEDAQNCLKALSEEQLEEYDFYVDCGLQDTRVGTAGTIAVHEYLESMGKEHGYELRDGGHNSAFYMAGMGASMQMHSDHFLENGLYDYENKYVELDGEWNYKLYRTYAQMFQYFAFMPALVAGKWTDAEAAVLPQGDDWKSWDVYQMPYDDPETGGLLSNEISPTWSEAWVVREFDLPANFTQDEEVTLLMGIIDDMDVVYINGEVVAASGFVDGNGAATLNIPENGGFNYTAADKADQVKFGKSYWEIQREYKIPAEVLNQGGTNQIAVRLYNNNSFGGFYSGNLYALCGNELALRNLKGLPTEVAESSAVDKAVAAQIEALETGDIDAYADTIASDYHNDAEDKEAKVAAAEAIIAAYSEITVVDEDAATYIDDEGNYWYSAIRTVTGVNNETAEPETISSGAIELCFEVSRRSAKELGNWNRCYGTSYSSELFGEDLTYSVYLPPSYYEKTKWEYPVVWLLHGRASSSTSYRDVDDIGAFMDELIESDAIEEMVVIMPDSGKYAFYRDSELKPGDKDNSGPWATQLTQELRGVVAEEYRVLTEAEFNGLTGNSMGGYGSMIIGTSNPDLYSSIGIHMGHLPSDALESLKGLSEEQLEDYDFYLDCGLQDTTVGPGGTIAVHEYLESVGKEHGYDLRDGGHNSAFYMSGMADSMQMHSDHFVDNGVKKVNKPSGGGGGGGSSSSEPETPEVIVPTEPTVDVIENFEDLSAEAWYAEAVRYAVNAGIMTGVAEGKFAPNGTVTRATVVQMLWAMEGKPVVNYAMTFEDVADGAWYAEAVRWAASQGVVTGYSEAAFGPNDAVSRQQLMTILYAFAKMKGEAAVEAETLAYADEADISDWAYEAAVWCSGKGIVSGKAGNKLDPAGTTVRSEAAQMLMKFTEAIR